MMSDTDDVKITVNPNPATLPVPLPRSPRHGAVLGENPVTFVCTDLSTMGTTEYEFMILSAPAGAWTPYTTMGADSPTASTNLPMDARYRWMCRGRTQGIWGPWSPTFEFELSSAPTEPPKAAPANVEVAVEDGVLSCSWEAVEGATSYRIEVQKLVTYKKKHRGLKRFFKKLFGKPTSEMRTRWQMKIYRDQGDTVLAEPLPGPGEYRFRVRARNGRGYGPYTEWSPFTAPAH
jgi:hypothetical protein